MFLPSCHAFTASVLVSTSLGIDRKIMIV